MEFCPSSGQIHTSTTGPDPSILKAFKVYNYIVGRGGEVELSELTKQPSPLAKLNEIDICKWLQGFSELPQGDQQLEKPCFTLLSKETNTVKVCLRIKLCSIYEQRSSCKHGANCLQWHICREFLAGNCNNQDCPRSHSFLDEQNIKKAKRFMLEKQNNASIRKIFAKNLPFLCERYACSQGCSNPYCGFIHMCPGHVKGNCETNENNCPFQLSHSADNDNNKAIFKQFGVPTKYVLAHVLFPKAIDLQPQSKDPSKIRHKAKVQNLNNLDTETTQEHQLVHENVTLNIHQNIPNTSKNSKKSRAMKEEKTVMNVDQNVMGMPKPGKTRGAKSVPKLMDQKVTSGPPGSSQFSEPFPSLPFNQVPNFATQRNETSEMQKNRREHKKKNASVNVDYMPKQKYMIGSKDNIADSSIAETASGNMQRHSGAKPKTKQQRKGFERSGKEDSVSSLLEEQEAGASESDHDNQPKNPKQPKKRQRNRNKKQTPQQESKVPETQDNSEEESGEVDLIQFGDDDYPINEDKLIDLEFDDCDPGLSQMTETQSEAMWDLFLQDLLYSLDDNSLSQSSDLTQELNNTDNPQPHAIINAADKAIFNCLVIRYGGTAKFSDISNNEDLWDPSFKEKEQWFRKRKAMFLLVEDSRGNIEEVKAVCFRARMCFRYEKGYCTKDGCPYFHICKEYITNGRCSNYKSSCKKSHTFREGHNKEVASKLFPGNEFTNQQLRELILSSTLQVCMDYNNHRCQLGKRCTKIHVCKNFGYRKCPRGQCRLLHENAFSTHNNITRALLARFKVHLDPKIKPFMFAKTLLQVDRENRNGRVQAADTGKAPSEVRVKNTKKEIAEEKPSPTDSTQYHTINADLNIPICLAFLVGKCDQGAKCPNHHCPLPYQWVYKSSNKHWRMLDKDKNVEVEKFYCEDNISDPSTNVILSLKLDLSSKPEYSHMHNVSYIYSIDLKAMQIGSLDEAGIQIPIRRLSTLSSVLIPDCSLATNWFWYWQNEHEEYEEYKSTNDSTQSMSKTIEGFYQEGISRYDFSTNNHQYRLYFNDVNTDHMYQKNMDPQYHTKRDVIRRPQFVSLGKFSLLKSNCKLPEDSNMTQLPNHWKKMTENQTLLLKRLNTTSREYKEIKPLFVNSMGDRQVTINAIDRVQNPFMWEKYSRKKEQMLRRSGSKEVDERRLFHGTSHKNIRSICRNNFDWRLSGEVTGDIYGKGTYFARDASFSHCYCHDDEDGVRYVFIAKVLVGSYTKGEKEYLLPPPKNPSNPHSDKFDSCVDNVDNPQVFVVSDNDQYYPEYVIEYSSESVVDQGNRSTGHRYSDPMVTGVSMATNLDPYPQYPIGQGASMTTTSSVPYHDQYSVGSYPIGQVTPDARPSSSHQTDLDPLIDQVIDVGASIAHYAAKRSSKSQEASRPRSEHYSRSTSMPSYPSLSHPGLQYSSRSTSGHAIPRQMSHSRDNTPREDPRYTRGEAKKNEGCLVM